MSEKNFVVGTENNISLHFTQLLPLELPIYHIDSMMHYAVATQAREADDPVLTGQEPLHVHVFLMSP